MEHTYLQKVFYSDTDAYGMVWHGTYLRWLEAGRILFCEKLGFDVSELQKQDIIFPIANLNIRYKSPAKLNDTLVIKTYVSKITSLMFRFSQTICDEKTSEVKLNAIIDVVAINSKGELYRKIPDKILKEFERAIQCND